MKLKIRKGAQVEVISGSEKGKRGAVLEVNTSKMRVRIAGIKMLTKHTKEDGIQKKEGFIHYSNVKQIEAAAATATPKKKAAKKSTKEKSA